MSSLRVLSTKDSILLHHNLLMNRNFPRSRIPKFALLCEELSGKTFPLVKLFLEAVTELEHLSTVTEQKLEKTREGQPSFFTKQELENSEQIYTQDIESFQTLISLLKELLQQQHPQLHVAS